MQRADSFVTQCALFTKVRETECSLKVQCKSHTESHDPDPPESLRKTQDVHGSPWVDDSEYSSGEIHVTALKDHRPIKSHSRPPKKIPADPHLVKVIEALKREIETAKLEQEALKREALKRDNAELLIR